jgi:hypothetical protein
VGFFFKICKGKNISYFNLLCISNEIRYEQPESVLRFHGVSQLRLISLNRKFTSADLI